MVTTSDNVIPLPQKRLQEKKLQNDNNHSHQLIELIDNLHKLLSSYRYLFASLYVLCASGRDLHNSNLLIGFSQINSWLTDRSNKLLQELDHVIEQFNQ